VPRAYEPLNPTLVPGFRSVRDCWIFQCALLYENKIVECGEIFSKVPRIWKGNPWDSSWFKDKSEFEVLEQPFSIFLPWRNPWNNFQVSGNPCIKIIISTAHGTLAWSVSCRYNNPIIIVSAILSRGWYFSVDLFVLANLLARSSKNDIYFFNHDHSQNS
jgi:hypothetical protein